MISTDQREARRHRIGSSDSPAIAGLSPYRTAHDVFLSKVQVLDDIEDKEVIEIGNDFELPLVKWAARELGIPVAVDVMFDHENGILCANMDGVGHGAHRMVGIEAKTGSAADYGEEGTDQVPEAVLVQVLHQIEVAALDVVWIPVLVARMDHLHRAMYRVTRNERAQKAIVDLDVTFWNEHVLPRLPPLDSEPSLSVVKRIRREPASWATVEPELVNVWEALRASRLQCEKEESTALAKLLAALGSAEGAEYGSDKQVFTYLEQSRRDIDVKTLRTEMPEVAQTYQRETTYRVARLTKKGR